MQDKDVKGKKIGKKPVAAKKDAVKPAVKKPVEPEVVPELQPESEDEAEISLDVDGPDTSDSEDEEADDQTATLLQGFESSDDEEDAGNSEGIVPKILAKAGMPNEKKVKKKLEKLSGREKVCLSVYHHYHHSSPHAYNDESRKIRLVFKTHTWFHFVFSDTYVISSHYHDRNHHAS